MSPKRNLLSSRFLRIVRNSVIVIVNGDTAVLALYNVCTHVNQHKALTEFWRELFTQLFCREYLSLYIPFWFSHPAQHAFPYPASSHAVSKHKPQLRNSKHCICSSSAAAQTWYPHHSYSKYLQRDRDMKPKLMSSFPHQIQLQKTGQPSSRQSITNT